MVGIGHPDIAKFGKKSRWPKGYAPNKGKHETKPWTYAKQLEWIKNQDFKPSDNLDEIIKQLYARSKVVKGKKQTINAGRLLMIRYWERALKEATPELFDRIIDRTDGKLVQPINLNEGKKLPLADMTDEQINAAFAEHIKS